MAKGDRITIGVRMGDTVASQDITAKQNGRNVSSEVVKENNISWLIVRETTRGGTVIEEIKVQLSDVVLIKTTVREN